MIKITEKAMCEICEKLGMNEKSLEFLGGGREDSDGTVYTYDSTNGKMVLKILAIPEKESDKLHDLEIRVKFANHLGENGISLAYPLRNNNGNLYETSYDNKYIYTAYVMKFCDGKNPETDELTDSIARDWGKITGKSHKVTKSFSDGNSEDKFSYKQEMDFFTNWCKNPVVKQAWSDMKSYLNTLPKDVDEYGFIHNDNHQRNILVANDDITIIDFDCSGRQFFMQDITTPAQGLMFDKTGGMLSPLTDADRLKRFFDCFIGGYEQENHLTDKWYKELDTFINYRRLLLYTCMQDWINTEPELLKNFLANIVNPPKIF